MFYFIYLLINHTYLSILYFAYCQGKVGGTYRKSFYVAKVPYPEGYTSCKKILTFLEHNFHAVIKVFL